MCLYPRLIKNRKYTKTKKNGGVIPTVIDERVKYVPIGCGKCMECRKKKSREWQIRLTEEIKHDTNATFVTLTFSNESIHKIIEENPKLKTIDGYELDNEIATIATRLFLERWRKKFKKSVKHWLVTELGHEGTENIHIHGIIWTKDIESIEQQWKYGYIWPKSKDKKTNYVNGKTVNYIVKYVNKIDPKHKYYNSKILTSPGIGKQYTNRQDSKKNSFAENKTNEGYKFENGRTSNLPIYYRNKIYTEEQREKLWLHKLNKNERWVGGEKVKADDLKQYNKILEWYREKNQRLGYGSDEKDWNREQYERQQRIINYEKRLNKIRNSERNSDNNNGNNNNNNNI